MKPRRQPLDVSGLPTYAFGHRSPLWWGTAGFIAIEATAFALALWAYGYLLVHRYDWPLGAPPPALLWGTLNTGILLASAIPNQWAKQAAEEEDLAGVRRWLLVCLAFGLAFLVVRGVEFASLNVRWDTSAYGSIVWAIMGLHTAHLLTDVADTAVLTALMFTRHAHGRRSSTSARTPSTGTSWSWSGCRSTAWSIGSPAWSESMKEHVQPPPLTAAGGTVWFHVLAPPLAWFASQQASYALAPAACGGGLALAAIPLASLLALLIVAWAAALAWRDWRGSGPGGSDEAAPTAGRNRFLGLVSLMLALLFGLVITAQTLGALILPSCQ